MPEKHTAYLDNCATTRLCPEAAQVMTHALTYVYGNPSSLHDAGLEAEKLLRESRAKIAGTLGCEPGEVVFTSGGTESNNLAVFGAAAALKRRGRRIVTSMIEHSSILGPAAELEKQGFEVIRLRPGENGCVRSEDIIEAVTPDTILVSLMVVNNETGAIQPVENIKKAVTRAGAPALIHCDAVQAYCKIPLRPEKLGIDLMSVSSHKVHGPKGAGALYIRKGARILPVAFGGGQEGGLRPGTEPVPTIAGFAEAAYTAYKGLAEYSAQTCRMRDRCAELLGDIGGICFNSSGNLAPHVLNVSVDGIRSETLLHFLSERGIYVSSGSACGRGRKSHVLTAMGLDAGRVDTAIRISFSRYNTSEDAEMLAEAIKEAQSSLEKAY